MREFLKGLDLDKETIDTVMAEHGKLVTGLKEKNEALAQKAKELESVDAKGLQSRVDMLTQEMAKREEEAKAASEKAMRELDARAESINKRAIAAEFKALGAGMGIVDADAVMKLADVDSVTIGEDGAVLGVQEALDALRENKSYLFGKEKPGATQMRHGDPPNADDPFVTAARKAAGLKE